ncbi:MAG: mannose-6-phosphate isomerase [Rikenellaceae bacterium]|nr:mannose-6-phosphate isomerase [Rikenellaceae bacterium]
MLYPLKFKPRLKERIWGGSILAEKKGKAAGRIDRSKKYGESWDLSCVKGDISSVASGMLKGNNLEELIEVYMGDLVGEKVFEKYGLEFPLLIKTLDCNDVLSVQVHPDDELAAERHNSLGKTEMWYVTSCEEGAAIYIGFNREITREEYLDAVSSGHLVDLLNRVEVKAGDAFFIPAGLVHALGKGVQVVEIQQTSDVTYRIYDWDRVDDEGKSRELHTALAVDAIDFAMRTEDSICRYVPKLNESVEIAKCKYFTTNILQVEGEIAKDYASLDSFVILMCIGGEAEIDADGNVEKMADGDVVLLPAEFNEVVIKGSAKLLEVSI